MAGCAIAAPAIAPLRQLAGPVLHESVRRVGDHRVDRVPFGGGEPFKSVGVDECERAEIRGGAESWQQMLVSYACRAVTGRSDVHGAYALRFRCARGSDRSTAARAAGCARRRPHDRNRARRASEGSRRVAYKSLACAAGSVQSARKRILACASGSEGPARRSREALLRRAATGTPGRTPPGSRTDPPGPRRHRRPCRRLRRSCPRANRSS